MNCNTFHEELIIDYIFGKLESKQRATVENHLTHCDRCQCSYQDWTRLLDVEATTESPSQKLKRSVMKNTIKPSPTTWLKPAHVFVATCAAAMIFLIGYSINPSSTLEQPSSFARSDLPNKPFLVQDTTDIYKVQTDVEHPVGGYAWINHATNEMMLLVDGLTADEFNDYQAWIQTPDELKDAGIFQVQGEKAQLYVKDGVINRLENIVVSKEPLGGSSQPTDPSPFLIQLNSD